MPQRLLSQLTEHPQSGEHLGKSLDLARSSVHALAVRLQKDGVPLVISRSGYALEAGTPAPSIVPLRGDFGRPLYYFGTIDSSQDTLRDLANADAPHGTVVIAERQNKARGRRGRDWQSMRGALSFSLLLCGPVPLSGLSTLPLAAGVGLQRALGGKIKWPNDLLDDEGRKVAGILLEADVRGEEARQMILGVGINLLQAPEGLPAGTAASWGRSRAEVFADVLYHLQEALEMSAAEALALWRQENATLGQMVRVGLSEGILEGVAEDIDESGALWVRPQAGGDLVRVGAGDVELIGRI